jgi:hypothetical protein
MTTSTKQSLAFLATSISFIFVAALPVMAQTTSTTPAAVQKGITRADTEITNRLDALNKVSARIQDIKNLDATDKASLSSEIQSQIDTMNGLKTKIDADTDAATLKTDIASITADYRIYALVIPQAQIVAAADRLKTIALDLSIVATKLQSRMTAAQAAGNDITTLQASLADIQAKTSDAQTQAQAAVSAVASLTPDQGNQTTAAANEAALKQARAALKTGTADVQAARKDAGSIIKALQVFHTPSSSASSTASTN